MRLILTLIIFALAPSLTGAVEFKFADAEKAREILLSQDDYFGRMSAPEIAIRLQSEEAGKTAEDLKAFYYDNLLDWKPDDIEQFQAVIGQNWPAVDSVDHLLPDVVWFIRGNDNIEGGLPHTHANAIIIQESASPLSPGLFFHELFHVLTRHNFEKHEDIYALLGFHRCAMEEPMDIRQKHLTNPDVPVETYYLPVAIEERQSAIVPFLYASTPAFDPLIENGFGGHFGFGLLEVAVEGGVCTVLRDGEGNSILHPVANVPGYLEAIGRNTGYIIHPEETLADNFVFLMLNKQDLPNPEIPERIEAWIEGQE